MSYDKRHYIYIPVALLVGIIYGWSERSIVVRKTWNQITFHGWRVRLCHANHLQHILLVNNMQFSTHLPSPQLCIVRTCKADGYLFKKNDGLNCHYLHNAFNDGIVTFHPRPSYYLLWWQDIWRYLYPSYAQNMTVKTVILYSK